MYDSPSNIILIGDKNNNFILIKSIKKDIELSNDEKLKIEKEVKNENMLNLMINALDSVQRKITINTNLLLYLVILIWAGAYYDILILTLNAKQDYIES